jgi:hypothetical protein
MKTLFRAVLVLVVIVGIGALLLGYWAGSSSRSGDRTSTASPGASAPSSTDTPAARRPADPDVQRARERGAEVGEAVATAGEKLKESMAEGSLVAKIKSKMALDDLVKARSVDVSVNDDVVTLSGNVGSRAERDRAVTLARETQGVRSVVDHLQIRP